MNRDEGSREPSAAESPRCWQRDAESRTPPRDGMAVTIDKFVESRGLR
jgi:hypothetical protein